MTVREMDAAREIAKSVATDIKRKGIRYSRKLVRQFQTAARPLVVDGLYGGGTAGAVAWYLQGTGINPPIPIFKPKRFVAYAPPGLPVPTPTQQKEADKIVRPSERQATIKRLAHQVRANILRLPRRKYSKTLLKQFQKMAGLTPDGLYGPKSAGALQYYTKLPPPPAQYGRGVAAYRPKT